MPDQLISVAQARERIALATPTLDPEVVEIADALGRVLARPVRAAHDVPSFASSAMDGYAVRSGPAGRTLDVIDESRAGAPSDRSPGETQAVRISTGATVPETADAVIRQEDVIVRGEQIETTSDVGAGKNIRLPGEDMQADATVLQAGARIGAAELAVAVAAGAATLTVARRPAVTVICTGDELRAAGEALGPGEIHNSNGVMLVALAQGAGASVTGPWLLRDEPAETRSTLASALAAADVVVVSGGVSVGPHDHVKPALASLGVGEDFWGVALQPGRPTWFGTKSRTLVFGLPGNPVSAAVTFVLFVRPALERLQGARNTRTSCTAYLANGVARNRRREQAIRVRLELDGDNHVAIPNGPQGSHIVTSLLGADGLAMIPPGEGELAAGSPVEIERLHV